MTKIHIPFYKKPNPYVGLEQFLNWDDFGVIRAKMLEEKDYLKLTEEDRDKCFEWEAVLDVCVSGRGKSAVYEKRLTKVYIHPSDSAKTLVVKHLGGTTPITNLFSDVVFTDELLKNLDEKAIKPTFMLPDIHSLEDLEELEKDLFTEKEVEEEIHE